MSKSKEGALLCETCKKGAFKLNPMVDSEQILLECLGCDRSYLIDGKEMEITDPSGGPNQEGAISWNWSTNEWEV